MTPRLARNDRMLPGDIRWVDFGTPIGSEPGGRRPAVVVGSRALVASSIRTITVVPCSTTSRGWTAEVPVEGFGVAQCWMVLTISRQRVDTEGSAHNVGVAQLVKIREVIAEVIGLDEE